MPENISEEEWAAAREAQPDTPMGIGARLNEMRIKVKAGPDHGVTREQAAELLKGLTGTQLRAVAAAHSIPVTYLQRTKQEVADRIVNSMVGSLLDHHAVVGYPDQGHRPEWTTDGKTSNAPTARGGHSEQSQFEQRAAALDQVTQFGPDYDRGVADNLRTARRLAAEGRGAEANYWLNEAEATARQHQAGTAPAVSWTDPNTGTEHVGSVAGWHGDTLDVEWSTGRVEYGIPVTDPKLTLHQAGTPQAATAAEQSAAIDRKNEERRAASEAGGGWPPPPYVEPADPFDGDTERKRQTEARIRATIDAKLNDGRRSGAVSMLELRQELADVPREEFDAAATNVFHHSDVRVEPLRTDGDDLFSHFKPRTPEEIDAAIPFGGTQINGVRKDDINRSILDDEQRWRSADRDTAASYFETCDESYLRTLAERFGVDPTGDAGTLRARLTDNAAHNQREGSLRSHETTDDLKLLHEVEKVGTNPATWTEQERKEVAAAAQRQKDNEWGPGAERARKFTDLPLDGSIPPDRQAAHDKDMAAEAAVNTGQVFIDHGDNDTCPAGQYHSGACPPTWPDEGDKCTLCGTDRDVAGPRAAEDKQLPICGRCHADRDVYNGQPFPPGDMTGIPDYRKGAHNCSRCNTPMVAVGGTQHFDADGGGQCTIKCPSCGMEGADYWVWSTGTAPAEDENLCDECGTWPGHSEHCPKKAAGPTVSEPRAEDKPRQKYAGTFTELEMNYDQIAAAHADMAKGMEERLAECRIVQQSLTEAETAVFDMEEADEILRARVRVLMEAMDEAQLDPSSLVGVEEAAEAINADLIQELCDAVDIGRDYAYEFEYKLVAGLDVVEQSERHLEATYGALAKGVQETGVSGKILEGSSTA